MTTDPKQLEALEADARFHRERYDLYRAKMYGMRPTSMARLAELERASRAAEQRLQQARRQSGPEQR